MTKKKRSSGVESISSMAERASMPVYAAEKTPSGDQETVEELKMPTIEQRMYSVSVFVCTQELKIKELCKKLRALEKRVKELETPTLEEAVRAHDLACGPSRPRDW